MLTRFSCNSSNYGLGFINAIIATATTSKQYTIYTNGCNSFEVLGNTVGVDKNRSLDGSENNTTTLTLCVLHQKLLLTELKAVRFYILTHKDILAYELL